MRRLLVLIPLTLAGCSSTMSNGIDWIVHGERTGVFEELQFITCNAAGGPSGSVVEVTFFFRNRAEPIGTIGLDANVTGGPSPGSHERVVFAGPTSLYTYLDSERPAVDTFDAALRGDFSNGIQTRYELAIGDHVPEYTNGEVSPVPQVQIFVPIFRIAPDQTFTDPNNGETLPVEGHIEDVRMYCDSTLEGI